MIYNLRMSLTAILFFISTDRVSTASVLAVAKVLLCDSVAFRSTGGKVCWHHIPKEHLGSAKAGENGEGTPWSRERRAPGSGAVAH